MLSSYTYRLNQIKDSIILAHNENYIEMDQEIQLKNNDGEDLDQKREKNRNNDSRLYF